MLRPTTLLVAIGLVCTASAWAEEASGGLSDWVERVRQSVRLPQATEEAREAGAPEGRIAEILATARERAVSAADVAEILRTETTALREGGNPDNFGAAVLELKADGLHGRELAEAIHAEQAARGMKKAPPAKGKGPDKNQGGPGRKDR